MATLGATIMSRELKAACVTIEEDSDLWLVGFADAEFNTERHLLLQRGKSPQAQDIALGLDGYHVEVDDQGKSCHGGIESFELFRDHAVVEFEDDALPVFGDKVIVVGFDLRQQQLDQLRNCLSKIFKGYECFLDRSA
jgi:immunity protein 10 of polymorphic toxin system